MFSNYFLTKDCVYWVFVIFISSYIPLSSLLMIYSMLPKYSSALWLLFSFLWKIYWNYFISASCSSLNYFFVRGSRFYFSSFTLLAMDSSIYSMSSCTSFKHSCSHPLSITGSLSLLMQSTYILIKSQSIWPWISRPLIDFTLRLLYIDFRNSITCSTNYGLSSCSSI